MLSKFITQPTDAERLAWLQLYRSENVGSITFVRLLQQFGSAQAAIEALPELARKGGRLKKLKVASAADAEKEMHALMRLGGGLILAGEAHYPPLLRQIDGAPPVISVLGKAQILHQPLVAIVGARNASLNGLRLAERLARDLASQGYGIVSGLARGIDTAAHKGSLLTGTVAVVAGGIDVIYPQENTQLHGQIQECGAIIAESPLKAAPTARDFPRRNRVISGLCPLTLVIEAAPKSGSLITAHYALEQGREVGAVPGSPLDPRANGTNKLIKDGAHLIEDAQDVLRILHALPRGEALEEADNQIEMAQPRPAETQLYALRKDVLSLLSYTPVAVDALIQQMGTSATVVQTILLEAELAGLVQRLPGSRVCLLGQEEELLDAV